MPHPVSKFSAREKIDRKNKYFFIWTSNALERYLVNDVVIKKKSAKKFSPTFSALPVRLRSF
jgi:hypothetical protein